MKLALLNLFFCASSTFAADSAKIVLTSDTTYVRGGVQYISQESLYGKKIQKKFPTDSDKIKYYYWYQRELEYDSNPANPNADLRLMKYPFYLNQRSSKLIV
jgi:hypothetical protein